jgi:hypothetical protein
VVIFTASLSKYADPLMDRLDPEHLCVSRLFREHCTFNGGVFVKDLTRLGRDMRDVIIVDNSPTAYLFQPDSALPCTSWYDDKNDINLLELLPVLRRLSKVPDVREVLPQFVINDRVDFVKATKVLSKYSDTDQTPKKLSLKQMALKNCNSDSKDTWRNSNPDFKVE